MFPSKALNLDISQVPCEQEGCLPCRNRMVPGTGAPSGSDLGGNHTGGHEGQEGASGWRNHLGTSLGEASHSESLPPYQPWAEWSLKEKKAPSSLHSLPGWWGFWLFPEVSEIWKILQLENLHSAYLNQVKETAMPLSRGCSLRAAIAMEKTSSQR